MLAAGAAAGHLLQSLPAAGSLTAQHQTSNRTGAGKAAQAALPELKLPAVASKALPVPPLSSPQSNRLQHAAGRGRHQGGGLTCAQAAYDRTGSMTMIQVSCGLGCWWSFLTVARAVLALLCVKSPCRSCCLLLVTCKLYRTTRVQQQKMQLCA